MKVLVTGGCGYVGSVLTPKLAERSDVICFDSMWFGNYISDSSAVRFVQGDLRKFDEDMLAGVDVVVHLANIANDPSVDLNPSLSWDVNVVSSMELLDKCIKNGVRRFVYASSGSVYGISDLNKVVEDAPLKPISTYNKTKMVFEAVCDSRKSEIEIVIVRPATVCGFSPRMRLDVSVNMLTYQAMANKKITVFGGRQVRPNIHIDDLVRIYEEAVFGDRIAAGIYNAGFENISIMDLALMIQTRVDCEIIKKPDGNDPRSYRQCSEKLLETGFSPLFSVDQAILDLVAIFKEGRLVDNPDWYTVKSMQTKGVS